VVIVKLKIVKIENLNERLPIIVDDDGIPNDHLNTFIIQELRGQADATVKSNAYSLMHIARFADKVSISIQDEMCSSCLTKPTLFNALIIHLQEVAQSQTSNVVALHQKQVQPDYFDRRIDVCKKYFKYLYELGIAKRRSDDKNLIILDKTFNRLITKLDNRKLKDKTISTKTGLSKIEQTSLFMGLDNIGFFAWNKSTHIRNALMIHIYYATGVRKGELASLTIPNCHTKVRSPYIQTTQNVKHLDPRTEVPHEKTRERIIPISKQLAKQIDEYIIHRNQSKDAKRQPPFLFLSSHAPHLPLSMSGFSNVFSAIIDAIPSLNSLGPHKLRHTFFENLDRHMHKNNYDAAKKTKIKNLVGGWSPSSKTSENYEKLATEEQCVEVLTEFQSEQDGLFNLISEDIPF